MCLRITPLRSVVEIFKLFTGRSWEISFMVQQSYFWEEEILAIVELERGGCCAKEETASPCREMKVCYPPRSQSLHWLVSSRSSKNEICERGLDPKPQWREIAWNVWKYLDDLRDYQLLKKDNAPFISLLRRLRQTSSYVGVVTTVGTW